MFGGALNRAGALTRAGALIKTYQNIDSPFPAHTQTLLIMYENYTNSNILKELLTLYCHAVYGVLISKYDFYMITVILNKLLRK